MTTRRIEQASLRRHRQMRYQGLTEVVAILNALVMFELR